jgi:hypothetical protein
MQPQWQVLLQQRQQQRRLVVQEKGSRHLQQ